MQTWTREEGGFGFLYVTQTSAWTRALDKQARSREGGPTTSILGGLKGSAADILVPDTTADLQGSSEVHA